MTKVSYEQMLPDEVAAARRRKPLAYLPIGAIEWHGVHNPLGLDTLKAHALCQRAAQAGGGLVMPPLWWGEHREIQLMEVNPATRDDVAGAMQLPADNFASGYMGGATIEQQAHGYNDLLFHIYHQVASLGFKALLVMCGHYPLEHYGRFTAAVFMRESPMRVMACAEHTLVEDMQAKWNAQIGDHAARWETSLLMTLCPGMVDIAKLPQQTDARFIGVGGEDPRKSSEAFGKQAVSVIVERMVKKGDQLLDAYTGTPG